MADRYQDRPFPSAEQARGESDPLAELARLIGQNDPLGAAAKPAPRPLQSRANVRPQQYDQQQYDPPEELPDAPPSPPAWMQRARHETPLPPPPLPQEYDQNYDDEPEYRQPEPVHPLHRYAAQQPQVPAHQAPPAQDDYYEQPQQYADEPQQDPSRYDDALYGRLETGEHDYQRDPAYPDDPYAYQGEYEEEPAPKKRSSGLMTVAAVLALAVVGTGAAFAYRTFVGSPRSGEPPIIRADNSPTKVVPAPSDAGAGKNPDRMLPGDGGEKLVSREETPVDVNSRSGAPRVVFPSLNPNANPPPASSVSPSAPMAAAANGTMPNNEPRKIRTLAVKGDAADNGGIPEGASAPPPRPAPPTRSAAAPAAPAARNPASANASANAPMSIAPQAGQASDAAPPTRMAATNPAQAAPATSGGYLVQVSSQRSEADAQASYRALQSKFPSVLGPHSSLVKRVDLGGKGIYYRAFAGPFASSEEAAQVCGSLKSAGGQCFIQRN
jgi:hypothetical protein